MGHVVHYDASDVRNINTLFFILLWYGYRFQKKVHQDTLRRTSIFASGGICGLGSALRCV
jgi:hypothetical protein